MLAQRVDNTPNNSQTASSTGPERYYGESGRRLMLSINIGSEELVMTFAKDPISSGLAGRPERLRRQGQVVGQKRNGVG